jgi:hypothetical protein
MIESNLYFACEHCLSYSFIKKMQTVTVTKEYFLEGTSAKEMVLPRKIRKKVSKNQDIISKRIYFGI